MTKQTWETELEKGLETWSKDEYFLMKTSFSEWIKSFIKQNRLSLIEEIENEIAEYSGINDIQTKYIIKLLNNKKEKK